MLCFRCLHRARYLDAKAKNAKYVPRPRLECGDITTSKYTCYMFKPNLPIITIPRKGDLRPRFAGSMISSREEVLRVVDRDEVYLDVLYHNENEVALGWHFRKKSKVQKIKDYIKNKLGIV